MLKLRLVLVLTALLSLLAAPAARADGALTEDPDIELANRYFAMHLGSHVATATFGTASLVGGVYQFSLLANGNSQSAVFMGIVLTSMGVASLVSAGTGADGTVRAWKSMKNNYAGAGDAERRLLREAEAARLRRVAINRAIGLAADGTFLGLGIVLMIGSGGPVPSSTSLGTPLVLNGAFLLGLDIFRLIVDDQTAQEWLRRNRDADAGYFAAQARRRSRFRVLHAGGAPAVTSVDGRMVPGLTFQMVGVF
jgi:hypothetical protein